MLYEKYAYQKRTIALYDLKLVTPVSESMKSQFYHSSRFTSPFFNLIVCVCVYVCVYVYFLLFLLFPWYFFLAQSRATVYLSQIWGDYPFVNACLMIFFFVQSRTREIARSSHGIKYTTERADVSRLVSLVRMEEPRLDVSSLWALTHPSSQRVRRSRDGTPRVPIPPLFIISIQK